MMGKKMLMWMAVLVVLLAVLAACGPTPRPTQEPVEPTKPQPTEIPPTEEPEESSLTIVVAQDPPSFNGSVTDTGYEIMIMEMTMLGVAEIDPYGNIFPELAAELPTIENGAVLVNEDLWTMTVTWQLRDDVYWADGEQVTADDVVFTWDAISDPEGGIWVPGADYVSDVTKIDDLHFTVVYSTVYPGYLTQFGGESVAIWPEHYCDADQGFVSWDCAQEPLSNGPYILEEWVRDDHLSFVRNPDYFEEGKPYIDRIIVRIVPDPSVRKTLILEGDADVEMWVSESNIQDFVDAPNAEVTFSPTGRWVMRLILNLVERGTIDPEGNPHPILGDVNVRRAIRMAIDVDTIVNDIFYGYSEPIWTEFFRPPYDVCDIPRPAYDPTGAAALLEAAGWTDEDEDGIRECHGCLYAEEGYEMSMEMAIYAEYGEELELAQQLMAENLADIGIDLNLLMIRGDIMWADFESGGTEQNGDFDINVWDDGYPGIDPSDQLWYFYYSEAALPDYGWNVARWINEDADYYIDESYILDEAYRQEVFCELAYILEDELPQILLFGTVDADAYSTRVEGVQATVNDIMTWNIADWKVVE